MFLDLIVAATTTPSGDSTLRPELDPASVTPGLEGFLATLFVVVLVIFLIRDMVKRIRRVRYAGEVEQARAQQQASSTDRTTTDRPVPNASDPGTRGDVQAPGPGGKHGPGTR